MGYYKPHYSREALDEPFAVIHEGMCITYLNPSLFYKNGLNENDLDVLKKLHCDMYAVHLAMEATNDKSELHRLAKEVEQLEFALQKAWKFAPSSRMHRWFEVPKCSCAKLDNMERLGTGYRIITESCPVHGNL